MKIHYFFQYCRQAHVHGMIPCNTIPYNFHTAGLYCESGFSLQPYISLLDSNGMSPYGSEAQKCVYFFIYILMRIKTEETSEGFKKKVDDRIHPPVSQTRWRFKDFSQRRVCLHELFNATSTHSAVSFPSVALWVPTGLCSSTLKSKEVLYLMEKCALSAELVLLWC